ncbi:hypothetical protein [Chitinophaga sp. CF418]|uniref:hypothetical protein n=1 Tax=Chitinophaga sp. CF418 TaxID=1855287 RepID=UPI0009186CFC|nr:hypothetical protein [Chitinophaga sp. CF418]SHN45554.1 hypothetical protein SAMN05216311_120105 [Chitinophaga sp. CF418]
MKQVYHLKWIDSLITNELNPSKADLSSIPPQQIELLCSQIPVEIEKIKFLIFNQIFRLKSKEHLGLLIKMYRSSLEYLLITAAEHTNTITLSLQNEALPSFYNKIIVGLEELSSFITGRFSALIQTDNSSGNNTPVPRDKVTCTLSVDQIGIFIRAGVETELIIGKSLSKVFKEMIPQISTPNRNDISWENARRKSYACERNDQNVLISKLELIIKKIKEY